MDVFLIVAAIVLLIFGALLAFMPKAVKRLSDFLNKNILPIEDKMSSSHTVSGIILMVLSVIVLYLAFKR